MKTRIKATKIKMTDDLKDYIQKKMDMLDKYLGRMTVLNADFEIEQVTKQENGDIYRAEINLEVKGDMLCVEKTEADIIKAIDKVKDHMARVIVKYKEKKTGK